MSEFRPLPLPLPLPLCVAGAQKLISDPLTAIKGSARTGVAPCLAP